MKFCYKLGARLPLFALTWLKLEFLRYLGHCYLENTIFANAVTCRTQYHAISGEGKYRLSLKSNPIAHVRMNICMYVCMYVCMKF